MSAPCILVGQNRALVVARPFRIFVVFSVRRHGLCLEVFGPSRCGFDRKQGILILATLIAKLPRVQGSGVGGRNASRKRDVPCEVACETFLGP